MEILLAFIISSFGWVLLALGWRWQILQLAHKPTLPALNPTTTLVVVVVVRNEAANLPQLLASLQAQTYPRHLWSVWMIDDGSTDGTIQVAQHFEANFELQITALPEGLGQYSPKKAAITWVMPQLTAELVVCTDGDCQMGEAWLATVAAYYRQTQAQFISAPVGVLGIGLLGRFQQIEQAALVAVGAVSMHLQRPTMCNGANMAYPKTAFEAVGGYAGVDQWASGDDEFLLAKIAGKFPKACHFLPARQATVYTYAQSTWKGFFQQRKRWASKWRFHKHQAPLMIGIYLMVVQVALLAGWFWASLSTTSYWIWWAFFFKYGLEFLFLAQVLSRYNFKNYYCWMPITQIFYPFYVLVFTVVAQGRQFEWKARKFYN
ncbi:MAG TPA: glycosyl transferase family 2 [Microscillaceae bacterium]|nr:glycosyl transferase family 2 [Microscillaceae bacterium]